MSPVNKSDLPLSETPRVCPVCAEKDRSSTAFIPHIRRCGRCGVLYMSPRPDQAAILRHYDAGNTFGEWRSHRGERERIWRNRLRLIQARRGTGRLLDVATGDGQFLAVARRAGFEVEGTEMSSAGAASAVQTGAPVRIGQLRDLGLPAESFDVVTMWHALEHVPDPGHALKEIHRLLRPGGMVFIAVPNERKKLLLSRFGIAASPFGDGTFACNSEIHLVFFTPSTLKRAVRNAGFDIEAFGVDDIYVTTTPLRRLKLAFHRVLCAVSGWHFSIAMWIAGRKPPYCRNLRA